MFSALGALNPLGFISSAAAIGGDIFAAEKAASGQRDTNRQNLQIAREQMDFQERMVDQAQDFEKEQTSTAYQRAMDDMESAGLNPILAYKMGGAASATGKTAPGAAIPMQNPDTSWQNFGSGLRDTVTTASRAMTDQDERQRIRAETKRLGEQANLTNTQIHRTQEEMDKIRKEVKKIQAETEGVDAENVQRKVVADFIESAEVAAIARYIGIKPELFKGIVRAIFMRGKK